MSSSGVVRIAVVGHTNAGKTSLLRTLTRDDAFGVVSDQPGTTRDVRGAALNDIDGKAAVEFFDTPGLEDAEGVTALIRKQFVGLVDPVAEIDAFTASDHGGGRYEQEAKVLRQLRQSDAAIYVIDVREPVLGKHREELRLLAACGRPLMPLLNFVAEAEANAQVWKEQLGRVSLHVIAEFDTVVFDLQAEQRVFEKLGSLIESKRGNFRRVIDAHKKLRSDQVDAACRAIATLLINVAAMRIRVRTDEAQEPAVERLQDNTRRAEQQCVDTLLEIFRFELSTYDPPKLPLEHERWVLDPFDPETAKTLGIRLMTNAAKGAAAGLAVDAVTGWVSLGAGTVIGATIGGTIDLGRNVIMPWLEQKLGYRDLMLAESTLAVLAARQVALLRALLRRGHASQQTIKNGGTSGWPSAGLRKVTLTCQAHPEWSALNESFAGRHDHGGVDSVVQAVQDSAAL